MGEKTVSTQGSASQVPDVGKGGALHLPETREASPFTPLARVLSHVDEHRAAGFLILVFLINVWLLNIVVHSDWLPVLVGELEWLLNPKLGVPDLHLSLFGFVAIFQVLLVGTLAAALVLHGEQDKGLLRIAAIALGLGLVGWATMILGIVGRLDQVGVNVAVLLLVCGLLLLTFLRDRINPSRFLSNLRNAFGLWTPAKPHIGLADLVFAGSLIAIAAAEYYHATTVPVLHWDALVYHATMAKMMFETAGIPTIAGPSVGIQMSANYPPLFPALGAFFYSQVGALEDVYLRLISPTAGILTTLFVYKTGSQLGGRVFARTAALFLALTPLFIATSIFAINYMLATLLLSAMLFFLLRATVDGASRYWVAAGVMYGFAFSTTYQAFFFLPAVAVALVVAAKTTPPSYRTALVANLLLMGIATISIGGVWYLRNLVVVGNPIFPFAQGLFDGKNVDPVLLARSVSGIRADSLYNFFGTFDFNPLDLPRYVFLNKSHFPVISVITLFGLPLALRQKNRAAWFVVLAFGLVPLVIVSSTAANVFPRYFIFAFPGLALVSALPLVRVFEGLARPMQPNHYQKISRTRLLVSSVWRPPMSAHRAAAAAFIGFMVMIAIFPASLALFAGQAYQESDWQAPYVPLLFLEHPSQDEGQVLASYYGSDPAMWQWLEQHLESGRVATFENKVYYLADSGRESFLYLDGWEARDLYATTDPAAIIRYLAQNGVRYVLDPSWIRHWTVYGELPLNRYLGMPQYFPLVQGTPSDAAIYKVGRIDNSLTARSPLAVSLRPFDLSTSSAQTAWTIPGESVAPRLFVETPTNVDKVSIEIDYSDRGKGTLTVNRRTAIGWAYGEGVAQLGESGRVQTLRFMIPSDKEHGYAELGLFASPKEILITEIRAQVAE